MSGGLLKLIRFHISFKMEVGGIFRVDFGVIMGQIEEIRLMEVVLVTLNFNDSLHVRHHEFCRDAVSYILAFVFKKSKLYLNFEVLCNRRPLSF